MIYLYDKDGNFIQLFNSEMDCAKYIGVQNAAISKAIKAKRLVRKNIMFQIYF
nr:MAG TPA: Intron encoded nuclease repeat motif [Bacteriophage sp.]